MSTMSEMLREAMMLGSRTAAQKKATLDSADAPAAMPGADDYTQNDIAMAAVAVIQQWAETDDLDAGETFADRLMAMFIGIADANKDGDISDDEQVVIEFALNVAWDYLVKCGVTDEDAGALLNDWDDEVADRVRDLVASVLPDGEGAAIADIDAFVFSEADQAPMLDAAYRKETVVRKGKKVRINKRVSGEARLTGKQKIAIRKARMKSHSATAMAHRLRSMHVREQAGL